MVQNKTSYRVDDNKIPVNLQLSLATLGYAIADKSEEIMHQAAIRLRLSLSQEQRCWMTLIALFACSDDEFTTVTDLWWDDQKKLVNDYEL